MEQQLWIWIMVGVTFTLYIGIAIWSRASSTKEFYVAGEGVSPLANGMATAADWMSAASFISMAGIMFNGKRVIQVIPKYGNSILRPYHKCETTIYLIIYGQIYVELNKITL